MIESSSLSENLRFKRLSVDDNLQDALFEKSQGALLAFRANSNERAREKSALTIFKLEKKI